MSELNRHTAEAILKLNPDARLIARVAELGRKADDGVLTENERDEYKALVDTGDLLALLKSKAHRFLDDNSC
jgi:hypothetical protein